MVFIALLYNLCFFWKINHEEVNVEGHHSLQLSTSVFGMVSVRKNRNATDNRSRKELDRRLRSVCTKLDEGNVKAGIRTTVGDDTSADFTLDNCAALKLKHPQKETCSVPDITDIDCFSTSEFFVHKPLMSFPNRSSAGLDGIAPKVFKHLPGKSNEKTGLNFLRDLTNLVNVILEGKLLFELRPSFFAVSETNCGKKARSFPSVVRKMCRLPLLRITSTTIRKTTSRCRHQNGAELASHVLRCL